jgi:hypothetical protein
MSSSCTSPFSYVEYESGFINNTYEIDMCGSYVMSLTDTSYDGSNTTNYNYTITLQPNITLGEIAFTSQNGITFTTTSCADQYASNIYTGTIFGTINLIGNDSSSLGTIDLQYNGGSITFQYNSDGTYESNIPLTLTITYCNINDATCTYTSNSVTVNNNNANYPDYILTINSASLLFCSNPNTDAGEGWINTLLNMTLTYTDTTTDNGGTITKSNATINFTTTSAIISYELLPF